MTVGTPPARWKDSARNRPLGWQSTRRGTSCPSSCQSFSDRSTSTCRAMAMRWIAQFVDAPMAEATAIAFWNGCRVMMDDGRRSYGSMSTIRGPVLSAIWGRCRYGAGVAAQAGKDLPQAWAKALMDRALPLLLRCPVV